MERATVTVIDHAGVRWPLREQPLDLLPGEHNAIAAREARVLVDGLSRSQRLDVQARDDGWFVTASTARAVLDGREIAVGARVQLVDGATFGFPEQNLSLRFDAVHERAFARGQRVQDILLLDCGGGLAPGRWPCLSRKSPDGPLVRGIAINGPDGTATEADDLAERTEGFDRERFLARLGAPMPEVRARFTVAGLQWRVLEDVSGVPLKLACRRGQGLEPALAVRIASRVARWLHETRAPLVLGTDSFALTWDGELSVVPPLAPRPSTTGGRGVVVELFVTLFPETGAWFREDDPASAGARDIWQRLVEPYLGAFGDRDPAAGDLGSVEEAMDALESLAHDVRPVSRGEVANIARGLFPDEWRRERELREELALLDAAALESLLRS